MTYGFLVIGEYISPSLQLQYILFENGCQYFFVINFHPDANPVLDMHMKLSVLGPDHVASQGEEEEFLEEERKEKSSKNAKKCQVNNYL